MSNKRNRVELYVFTLLLTAEASLAGCGRDDISSERADSGRTAVDIEYTEPDKSSEEERTAGQAGVEEDFYDAYINNINI